VPGRRRDEKGGPMYIGVGTLVLIVVVLLIIYLVRRAWQHASELDSKEWVAMGEVRNKARNAAQQAKGKAKESTGRATGNQSLKAKGKADRAKAKTKKAAERVKDRLRWRDEAPNLGIVCACCGWSGSRCVPQDHDGLVAHES
jgi:uncharacterized protein YjbJ (UPF0337 family)